MEVRLSTCCMETRARGEPRRTGEDWGRRAARREEEGTLARQEESLEVKDVEEEKEGEGVAKVGGLELAGALAEDDWR